MIIAYLNHKTIEPCEINVSNAHLLQKAIWIDLLSPTRAEELEIEKFLGLDVPTREEMGEIELSSRLYKINNTLFMTATMIAQSETPEPKIDPVTFIVTQRRLITIRYIEPLSFKWFINQLPKLDTTSRDVSSLLIGLLDTTVDRLADILEFIGHRLDEHSKRIFGPEKQNSDPKLDFRFLMREIGGNGELNTKARESLLTFNRLVTFFAQSTNIEADAQQHLTTLSKDIVALSDHANFISNKVIFMLDAILGMVGIEQNNIIKIFTVAAVIFLPPTLIASIYGMNFHFMPELSWKWGFVFSICLMLLSSWLPYKYFKWRKWL